MVTVCIKNGYIKQEISLPTISIVALLFIVTGAIGTQVILEIQNKKRSMCQNYVQYPSTIQIDYNVAYIVCILISVVMFLLAGYQILNIVLKEKNIKAVQFIVPGFLIVFAAITIGLSVLFYTNYLDLEKKPITPLNSPSSIDDSNKPLINYCSTKDGNIEALYVTFNVFFSLGIIGIFLYLYNFITSICVSS